MNCPEVRNRLAARAGGVPDAALARHLEDCPKCARFARRMTAVRDLFEAHHAEVLPDAGFAARVVARLPAPAGGMAWAAVRLLPATLALALVLTGWCLLTAPSPSSLVEEAPSDDLLTWVMASAEEGL